MKITAIKTLTREEPQNVLFTNLLALELLLPEFGDFPFPCIRQMEETTCYFHAGIITYHNEQGQCISSPVHLAHTGPVALIVDARTGEILTDMWFSSGIIEIVEKKQAFIIHSRTPKGLCVIRTEEPRFYQQWKQLIQPIQPVESTTYDDEQEDIPHVHH